MAAVPIPIDEACLDTVTILADAIEAKDPLLRGHSEEVSGHVAAVAARLGMDAAARERLVLGSLLHDVGKLAIPVQILLKPGALLPEERAIVEDHPVIGSRIVAGVAGLDDLAPAILHHHERYDGGGYPDGLGGDEIPLEARVIAVADCFSAMTADRPYRARMSVPGARSELERCAGSQFDPEVVSVFCEGLSLRAA